MFKNFDFLKMKLLSGSAIMTCYIPSNNKYNLSLIMLETVIYKDYKYIFLENREQKESNNNHRQSEYTGYEKTTCINIVVIIIDS